jgi:drug/metabolite transporter (DMT)-like permease
MAIFLIALGTLLLLWPDLLGFGMESGLALGVLALLSAGGLLVLRLREDRFDDPDDDGAVL